MHRVFKENHLCLHRKYSSFPLLAVTSQIVCYHRPTHNRDKFPGKNQIENTFFLEILLLEDVEEARILSPGLAPNLSYSQNPILSLSSVRRKILVVATAFSLNNLKG